MAITYALDVAPHLFRAKALRARRLERWRRLHKHDGRAAAWRLAIAGVSIFWALAAYGICALF
ncbi:MAG TPA: hypothetical protein VG501_08460 [Rhizomicrobium sp.]|nr:hypothetical protein [Rhizomicrobium sp.]